MTEQATAQAVEVLRDLLSQIEGIGIEKWHGAEGLSLDAARAIVAEHDNDVSPVRESGKYVYSVRLMRTITQKEWGEIEIEASSANEAVTIALETARENESKINWDDYGCGHESTEIDFVDVQLQGKAK